MALTCGRRIFVLAKNSLLSHPAYLRLPGAVYSGRASCSTGGGQDGPHTPEDVMSFDAEKLEELLKDDIPVDMSNPYQKEKVQCLLCKYDVKLDYKNVRLLSQFVSPYTGKMYGRNITRLCRKRQEELKSTIAKSKKAGYMAVMLKSVEFLKDPKLFDPNNPIRPHNF
ncbi:small ribosomal subunit protein bS18m-like [Scylla paramamosain]|uniref:small ribosomal subunit protein bS18m-like n=1 Tax=Scylla paramamosain TaxID=85552 RepID=UPI003082CE3E